MGSIYNDKTKHDVWSQLERQLGDLASNGWVIYYANFMYEPLDGTMDMRMRQMRKAITKFYGSVCTRFVRNPAAVDAVAKLPRMWLFPDRPGTKKGNQSIREVKFNEGIHYNGPIAFLPTARSGWAVEHHIQQKEDVFRRHGGSRIHVVPVWGSLDKLCSYQTKTLTAGLASYDDVLVLPRSISELPEKAPPLSPAERAFKDMQAAFNWSDELAAQTLGAARE